MKIKVVVKKKIRIQWIDYVRACSMMLIILGHTWAKAGFLQNLIYAVNVPIFFILSGFLTKHRSIKATAKKGFYTLIIPYLITAGVMELITLIRYFVKIPLVNYHIWYHYIIATLYGIGTDSKIFQFNIPAIGAIWFLLAMYFGNIIYQVLLKLTKNNIQLFICSLSITVIGFAISHYIILPLSLNASLISIIFYCAGNLIRQYSLLTKWYWLIIGLLLWVTSALITPFWFNIGYTKNIFITLLGAISGSFAIIYLFKQCNHINITWFSNLGKWALITLAFHVVDINCFGDYGALIKLLNMINMDNYGIIIMTIIYRILICWLITYILVKSNVIKKLFNIK